MISTVVKQYGYDDTEIDVVKVTYIDGTESLVPKVEGNRHYQEVLQWVADGNTIGEPE